MLGEYDQNGNVIQEHLWLGDTPVAMWAGNQTAQTYFVFADQIDTPRAIADATGKILWRWDGEAFGLTQPIEDVDGDSIKLTYNLRFPGQYFDKESNLHYNGWRYYDPVTGRYVSSDPIGLEGGSLSPYAYVDGNPLGAVDPDGLEVEVLIGGSNWYAHAAVNVNGTVYSNGRYPVPGESPTMGGLVGPNVLTVQSKSNYFETSPACACGTKGYVLNLTPDQEKKIIAYYKGIIAGAKKHPKRKNWYILPGNYTFLGNNCATLSANALGAGMSLQQQLFLNGVTPMSLGNSLQLTPGLVNKINSYN